MLNCCGATYRHNLSQLISPQGVPIVTVLKVVHGWPSRVLRSGRVSGAVFSAALSERPVYGTVFDTAGDQKR
jgi:hypothetical protein